MKIDPATIVPSSAQPVARVDALYGQQWRKSLEDAQWQARQRIQPQADNRLADAAANPGPGDRTVAGKSAVFVPPAEPGNTTAAGVDIAGRSRALSRALESAVQATTGAPRSAAAAPSIGIASGVPLLSTVGLTQAPTARAAVQPVLLQWTALPEWPEVVFHANLSGKRLSIGVRDRELQGRDALDLYYRLRAELGAAGLELAELTVNGLRVLPPDDAQAQT